MSLPDVQQNTTGFKKLPIEKVGVRGIKVPFHIFQKGNSKSFSTIATISSYCNLVEDVKGINMSRISRAINEVLQRNKDGFTNLNDFVYALQEAHGATDIYIKANFEYLYDTLSPIEKVSSIEPVNITFESKLKDDKLFNYITVKTTEMSLCPCSKEMSLLKNNLTMTESLLIQHAQFPPVLLNKINNAGFGAHNQKSTIEVTFEFIEGRTMWIEDIMEIIRENVSSPTWSTLKRGDEKYVTERSYMGGYYDENKKFVDTGGGPMFVEDIVRNIAFELDKELDNRILDYSIIVNNHESIHSDDIMATAIMTAGRELK